ncbi:Transient receptor potential cation channel subfamily M member 1 [Frankliniella fusca]|uniref:Transient receptor potential cation channel subfamily M member 1 n=1 Tax=Frankliniella fusca TaxID=407009 RepID=A0AAE1LS67_9NEOP|nr:Transient receptor potential cation channel subfamily M member 1 [Frankliniella fusca]KAK3929780.1 Transient receptor potential cation channel subfamily M member 1 [Frankliniella fusca]
MDPMDRKTVKRRFEREAIRESNKRVRTAEILLEWNRRSRNQAQEDGCDRVDSDEESDRGLGEAEDVGNGNNSNAEEQENEGEGIDVQAMEGERCREAESNSSRSSESDGSDDNFNDLPESDNEPEPVQHPNNYVREQLSEWALCGGVSMSKVDDLLKRLQPIHQNLPLSYKTLLKTPRNVHVVDCGNGSLWYYGIAPQLHRHLTQEYLLRHDVIAIDINIDSVPLFNKSSTNFVPILGKLVDSSEPFIIGIFCGTGSDPADLDTFLHNYVQEVNNLKSNGFQYEEKTWKFRTRHYILDQKARASIKCVKGVRGYFCCEKCTVKGTDYMNRMCLLNHDCQLRTDENFIDMASLQMMPRSEHFEDTEIDRHVIGISPLLSCESKMVSKFRLDSMHMVYKGVFLRWFEFLWSGHGSYSLGRRQKQDISLKLGSFRPFCPSDFNRKPFAIKSEKLKATELRRILLYDGLVVFRKLDKNIFLNFMLLHTAIYILCSPKYHKTLNHEADRFIRAFVNHAENLFGKQFIVYNVHSMIHLPSECFDHGPLDTFGAFPYENLLGKIKSQVTSRYKPLQQIAKREMEKVNKSENTVKPEKPLLQMPSVNDPHEQLVGQQYKKIRFRKTVLSVKKADSCCALQDGTIICITNIVSSENGPIIVGKRFAEMSDYYQYPICSSLLNVYKVKQLEERSFYLTLEDISHKCYLMPLDTQEFYAVVVFTDQSCQAIPTSWLDEEDGQLIAFYPKTFWKDHKVRKAIENCANRNPDTFDKHWNVRVLHYYNSLIVARNNLKKAEDTSSLDSENDVMPPRRKRKRESFDSTDNSDDSDDDEKKTRSKHPAPPQFQKALQQKIKNNHITQQTSKSRESPSRSPSTVGIFPHDMVECDLFEDDDSWSAVTPLRGSGSNVASTSSASDTDIVKKFGRTSVLVKSTLSQAEHMTMLSIQMEMRTKLERMERMLSTVMRSVKPSQKLVLPKDIPNLPLQTQEEFDGNENFLADSANRSDTSEYLATFINMNMKLKDQTYTILRKCLADNLASQYNWKGRDKKAFCSTNLCSALFGAILDCNKNSQVNMAEVEGAIKEWLKYAPKRASGYKKPGQDLSNSSSTL